VHRHARDLLLLFSVLSFVVIVSLTVLSGSASADSSPGPFDPTTTKVSSFKDLLLTILVALVAVVGVLILPYAVTKLVRIALRLQHVVSEADNASGNSDLDGLTKGIAELIREQFAIQRDELAEYVGHVEAQRDKIARPLLRQPLPLQSPIRSQPNQTVGSLPDAVGAAGGEQAGPILKALTSVLFRPRGIMVDPTLVRRGDGPADLGIVFALSDLLDGTGLETFSVWEPEDLSRRACHLSAGTRTDIDANLPADQGTSSRSPEGGPNQPPASVRKDGIGSAGGARLLRVAQLLAEASVLEDAATFAEASLVAEVSDEARAEFARILQVLRIQSAAKPAYGLGQQLVKAGRKPEAIDALVGALPESDAIRHGARKEWRAALGSVPWRQRRGYEALGTLYLRHAHLLDEALDLWNTAEKRGSEEAVELARSARDAAAAPLAAAADTLIDLGRFSDARKYISQAQALVPNHVPAAKAKARLAGMAPEDSDPVRGHLAVATRLMTASDLKDSIDEYKAALQAAPDSAEAASGLEKALSADRSDEERYVALLPLATRVLALKLLFYKMVRDQSKRFWFKLSPSDMLYEGPRRTAKGRRALITGLSYNYVGLLFQGMRERFASDRVFLLEQSEDQFQRAKRIVPHYWQAPTNLGDTCIMLAESPGLPDGCRDAFVDEALQAYGKALKRLQERRMVQRHPTEQRAASVIVMINRGLARLMTKDPDEQAKARSLPKDLDAMRWRVSEELEPRPLMNLADWYGRCIAVIDDPEEERTRHGDGVAADPSTDRACLLRDGRAVLAAALVRDWEGLRIAGLAGDADLKPLVKDVSIEALRTAVQRARESDPCIHLLKGTDLSEKVNEILAKAHWS